MEFDLDKALEDVPIHVEDTTSQTPTTPSQVLPKLEQRGAIVELPSEEEKKLQHFTKLRPRRNKKTHSSKVPVSKASGKASLKNNFKFYGIEQMNCIHSGIDLVSTQGLKIEMTVHYNFTHGRFVSICRFMSNGQTVSFLFLSANQQYSTSGWGTEWPHGKGG